MSTVLSGVRTCARAMVWASVYFAALALFTILGGFTDKDSEK